MLLRGRRADRPRWSRTDAHACASCAASPRRGARRARTSSPACPTAAGSTGELRRGDRAGPTPTGGSLALLVIDLDHFKELNDTLGHHAGDRVLAQLGPRIRTALRTGDDVARLGGDEFAVLLPGAGAAGRAPASGSPRRCGSASPSRASSCRSPPASASRCFPEHGHDAETLLQRADVAMYQAKHAPLRHRVLRARARPPHPRAAAADRRAARRGRRRAPDAALPAQARPRPQPDHRRRGARALAAPRPRHGAARRVHPAGGADRRDRPAHRPGDPQGAAPGRRRGGARHRTSRWRSTSRPPTCSRTAGPTACWPRWRRYGVRPDRFVIEITEDVLMTDPDRSLTALAALSAAGVRVALDDFGTGYSSLSYLKQLPRRRAQDRPLVRVRDGHRPGRRRDRADRRSTSAAGSASASSPRASRTRTRCGG